MKVEKLNKFSVSLGLLDYINPILYSITIITIIINTYFKIESPYNNILLIGGIISILFGFVIPTGKVIVGLGIIKFKMPVELVFLVNTGILLSGTILSKYVFNMNLIILMIIIGMILFLLLKIYQKSKKMNTVAVLIGAFGYFLIYISLITISIKQNMIFPILLFLCAIALFLMLCGIGIKGDLKNPKIHWIIELSNILCQSLVAIGTMIVFH